MRRPKGLTYIGIASGVVVLLLSRTLPPWWQGLAVGSAIGFLLGVVAILAQSMRKRAD